MADDYLRNYTAGAVTTITRQDPLVVGLAKDYGGRDGQEGALLNGLLAMGIDPNLVRSFADADPNRRYLDDAITRALRAGITPDQIQRALKGTRLAATGDPQGAIKALGVDPNQLPPEGRSAFDAIANRQPLPFLDRGQTVQNRPGGLMSGSPTQPGDLMPTATGNLGVITPPKPGGTSSAAAAAAGLGPGGGGATATAGAGARAGGAPTPGTVTANAAPDRPTDPFPTDPSKVRDWLNRNEPQWAYLLDIPEVAAIVRDPNLWKAGADDGDLQARLMQTDWWKKTEPDARKWLDLAARDPASARDQIGKRRTTLTQTAQQLGITIPANMLDQLSEDSLKFNWDDNEIRSNLSSYFHYDQNQLTGAAQAADAHIRQSAKDWLVPIDDNTLQQWVTQIVNGTATTDYFDTYLANQAKSLYPQLAEPISRGVSVSQWMDPYKTLAAQTLDMNPEQIDLRDPKWLRAINQVGADGTRTPMTLYDWQNLLKTDDTYGWDKTQQGRDHGAQLARNIASQFGYATGGGL